MGITLFNLLQENPNLFDNVVLPEGVDRDMVADTIISLYGTEDIVYSPPRIFDYYNRRWFQRKELTIKKLYDTLHFEYNPIENYNRKEDYAEINDDEERRRRDTDRTLDHSSDRTTDRTEKVDTDNTTTTSSTKNTDSTGETINTVAAYNAEVWVNDSKSNAENSEDVTESGRVTDDKTENLTGKDIHKDVDRDVENVGENETTENDRKKNSNLWVRGNIGVTTTQHMIENERRVVQFDLYEWIANTWADSFIVQCWN